MTQTSSLREEKVNDCSEVYCFVKVIHHSKA